MNDRQHHHCCCRENDRLRSSIGWIALIAAGAIVIVALALAPITRPACAPTTAACHCAIGGAK